MKVILFFTVLFVSISLFAQSPQKTVSKSLDIFNNHIKTTTPKLPNLVPSHSDFRNSTKELFQDFSFGPDMQRMDSLILDVYDNENSIWVEDVKLKYFYNPQDLLMEFDEEKWDSELSTWKKYKNSEYFSDESGILREFIEKIWNEDDNLWVENLKYGYSYNATGSVSEVVEFEWENSAWLENTKFEYLYNEENNIAEFIESSWVSLDGQWIGVEKYEYNYNESGNLLNYQKYIWGDKKSSWVDNLKSEYSYSDTQKVDSILYYIVYEDDWAIVNKEQNIYNDSDILTEYSLFDWNPYVLEWEKRMSNNYLYDSEENLTNEEQQIWDADNSQWVDTLKMEYSYDLAFGLSDLVLPFGNYTWDYYFVDPPQNMLLSYIDSNFENDTWNFCNRKRYFYSLDDTGISIENSEKIKVYPNPASSFIHFELKNSSSVRSIEVYNIHGQSVIRTNGNCNNKIDVSGLDTGVYFLVISQEKEMFCTRILVNSQGMF